MGKVCFLFPGQGAQKVGMGQDLLEQSQAAREVFEEADDALGEKLSALIKDGPEDALKLTANTQPAILTLSVACQRALMERSAPAPDVVAGHSLGEYSALVAAGSLTLTDAVRAVRARGEFMQAAVPEGEGAMAAVMGIGPDAIAPVLAALSEDAANYVAIANENGPAQTVIAGTAKGVEAAQAALKDAGAKRVIPLPVSAPFHCKLMAPVQDKLEAVLTALDISDPLIPVVTNVEAAPNSDGARVLPLLIEQVTHRVRFTEMATHLLGDDVDTFVEVGPGKTLVGILKRMDRDKTYLDTDSADALAATADALNAR